MRQAAIVLAAAMGVLSALPSASAAQEQHFAKFSNDGNCALHIMVRVGNDGAMQYRFILDSGQIVHVMLPYWSTYATQCDRWPVNPSFAAVVFDDKEDR